MMSYQDQIIYQENKALAPTTAALDPITSGLAPVVAAIDWDKEDVIQVIKGRELEYTRNLEFMVNMDLSSNQLIGCIPKGLTALF